MIARLDGGIDVFLQPGEWWFGDAGSRIRTTLGSCVSIVLWHPERRIGGMCHYLLPARDRHADEPLSGRYAEEALTLLLDAVREAGTLPRHYQVKLFGGADMLPVGRSAGLRVGARNIAAARELLARHALSVTAQCVGGRSYRQLRYLVASGDVWVRQGPLPGIAERLQAG